MADYQPLIARAVAGLEKNSGENRRALYERARNALLTQLRGVTPTLEESEITRERLALEDAIRKVEAETARSAREAARPLANRRAEARRDNALQRTANGEVNAALHPDSKPADAENRKHADVPTVTDAPPAAPIGNIPHTPQPRYAETPRGLASQTVRGRREAAHVKTPAEAGLAEQQDGRPARQEQQTHPTPAAHPHSDPLAAIRQGQPETPPEDLWTPPSAAGDRATDGSHPPHGGEFDHADTEAMTPLQPRRSYRRAIRLGLVAIIVVALAATLYWQSAHVIKFGQTIAAFVRPSGPPPREAVVPARPKIPDRLGQPSSSAAEMLAVAQRVVLYEEDPNDPQGKRFSGTAVWRTETKAAASGRPPELAVRADIEVPERKMTVTWSLRRNTDPSLPASHTIEVSFNVPTDLGSGGVQNVPGVLMKQAEQTRGVPLAGLAVKVTPGFFLIGLSALEADALRNVQLLKERSWLDIPIVYNNNRRAILAVEKGTPGEKVFGEVFASWRQ